MAEAVVDLPDPMSLPPSVENADELLSQLAGEQIDRLLSEGELPAPTASAAVLPDAEAPTAQPIAIPLPEAAPAKPAQRISVEAAAAPVPTATDDSLPVKILQAVNAPFAACPEWLRDLLGKFAILFFINAVGFILFALLMKHR